MRTQKAIALTAPAPAVQSLFHQVHALFRQIWPPAAIACGLGLTAVWVSLLGYGLVSVIELAL
jgi:hypothetical protein